jgi:hypothetical protein
MTKLMEKAEREKLRISATNSNHGFVLFDAKKLHALLDHIDALERDADRYRWLRSHANFRYQTCKLQWYLPRFTVGDPMEKLDEHIDAVIASAQEVKGADGHKAAN